MSAVVGVSVGDINIKFCIHPRAYMETTVTNSITVSLDVILLLRRAPGGGISLRCHVMPVIPHTVGSYDTRDISVIFDWSLRTIVFIILLCLACSLLN